MAVKMKSITATTLEQSISGNYSKVRITCVLERTGSTTYWEHPYERNLTITCDGQTRTQSTTFPQGGGVGRTVTYYSDFDTIYHNADGTKYIEFSGNIPKRGDQSAISGSGNATLPTIPRQPTYNSINASNITETSVRLTAGIDTHGLGISSGGWDVSTDGGATWTYYANDVTDKTITGLQPNTRYWYRGYCQTAGGGSNSWWNYFDTYDYPKANAVNDITLRQNTTFTIGFYNPFGKTFSYQIISNVDSSVIYTSGDINTTSVTLNMNDVLTPFYETIPSAKEGTYYVKTTCSGIVRNSENKKYFIDADTCKPIMSVVGYEDINANTLALTNDTQKLVVGYSTIQVTIADGNKATPQYDASIIGYKIKNGDYLSPIVSEVEGEDVVLTCTATSGIIEVYAIDSREQTGIYQIVNTTMINYEPITKNQSPIAQRCDSHGDPNGVGEYVKITLSGTFWNDNFGNVTNSITSITYNYANAKTPSQTTSGTTTITETTSQNNYNVSQLILGDTPEGFDISNSYIINVTVSDELSSTTFAMTLASGTPHISYAEDGIGIKKKFDNNNSATLQVGGKVDSTGYNINGVPLEIPTINNSYSTATDEVYACDYVNKPFNGTGITLTGTKNKIRLFSDQDAWISTALSNLGVSKVASIGNYNSGEFALGETGGRIYPYADGKFYQNEGTYPCLDTSCVTKIWWDYQTNEVGQIDLPSSSLTNYDFLIIIANSCNMIVSTNWTTGSLTTNGWNGDVGGDQVFVRDIYYNQSTGGVTIGACYGRGINGCTTHGWANKFLVPREVWGVKIWKQ